MRFPIKYLLLLWVLICTQIYAQENVQSSFEFIERIADSYAEESSEEIDLTSIIEELEQLIESPFNFNTCTTSELEQLHFLTYQQIEQLISYRDRIGQVYSIYELYALDGFSEELVNNLSLFMVFKPIEQVQKSYLNQSLNIRYAQSLEKANGFLADENSPTAFEGIAPSILLKYKAQKGDRFRFGITAENDSGEGFFGGSNKAGFDFYSGYLGFKGKKFLKQLFVGDYYVKTGQGLIQWSNYGIRKSTNVTSIRQSGQGLQASTSSDENRHFRGGAAQFNFRKINLTAYFSNNRIDANVVEQDEAGNPSLVSSIQSSGYHRTLGEIEDENALKEQFLGADLRYKQNRFSFGINGLHHTYSCPLQLSNQLYNRYNFSGKNNYNASTDFLWVQNKFSLFGEAALSKSGGKAAIVGLEAFPCNTLNFSVLVRNYARDFHSIKGKSFAESSKNNNEKGIYAGLLLLPYPHVKVSAYADTYTTYWMTFNSSAPIRGNDLVLQLDYTPFQKIQMYVRLKSETKSAKGISPLPIRIDASNHQMRLRYQLNWKTSEILNMRFRTEYSGFTKGNLKENGFLLYTDIIAKPINRLSVTMRMAWFKTDGFNSRIYAYENDVPQYFYIPAYYKNGFRYYFNLRFKISSNFTIYGKFAQFKYIHEPIEIAKESKNVKTTFKLHSKYRF